MLGIIGRNGAGKSTLLKVLSRITRPTEGRISLRGRVGSLLEVGTGFHPELTGRENIFLGGAIHGMSRPEVRKKFDEIVGFAGVERFLDTPVKRYSSGMHLRLGFAVAAHLQPEILLVDEVLAVGDAEFQKKCLGKMNDVAEEGRTVVFVSHNLVAVRNLCSRVIWLQHGRVVEDGNASEVASLYQKSAFSGKTEHIWNDKLTAPGNGMVRLRRMMTRPNGASTSDPLYIESPFLIEVEYWNLVPNQRLHITLHLLTEEGVVAFSTSSFSNSDTRDQSMNVGLYKSVCHIPGNLLNTGTYRVVLLVVKDQSTVVYRSDDVLTFDVAELGEQRGAWYGKEPGVVRPLLEWQTMRVDQGKAIGS